MTPVLLVLAATVACGGKKATPAASADAPAPQAQAATGDFPSDAKSQAFLETFTSTTINNFPAVDSAGAKVVLSTLNFSADNTWAAEGYVDAGEEKMECTESGSWTMDPAESASVATINWEIGSTDCIGRTEGDSDRAQITIKNGDVAIAFR